MTSETPLRVLIVDDEYLAAQNIRETMETIRYTVVGEAASGKEAIEMAPTLRPDVVLMDIELPDMSGFDVTRQIQDIYPVPVIALTAHKTPQFIMRASEAGMGSYLLKPPSASDIQSAIVITVARYREMLELQQLNAVLQQEITKRQKNEQQLEVALREKDLLLKEVYHRVKNNFQTISRLLSLQADKADPVVRNALLESISHIDALSFVHECLYHSSNLADIDFSEYAYRIIANLFHSYKISSERVALKFQADEFYLPADKAIPCALILNELVTNALKYGFPEDRSGELRILIQSTDGEVTLKVSDTGAGLPPEIDVQSSPSLGLKIVRLLTQQLRGTLEYTYNPKTTFTITFPE